MVTGFLNKFGQNRERVNEIKSEMLARQLAEQQILSNNERNFNRMVSERRQDQIKKRLIKLQRVQQKEIFAPQTILKGDNVFKNGDSMLKERNLFRHGEGLLNQRNLFRGHR